MSNNEEIDNLSLLEEKKTIILSICSNFLQNKLDELYVEKAFSNTDILLLLDDLMTSLYDMIQAQIRQIKDEVEVSQKEIYCIQQNVGDFKNKWDKELEKIANKVVRSQATEKTIFQTFNQVDKSLKSIITSLFYKFKNCIEY